MFMSEEVIFLTVVQRFYKHSVEIAMSTSRTKPKVINAPSSSRKSPRVAQKTEKKTKFKQDTLRIPRMSEYLIPRKSKEPILFPPTSDYHLHVSKASEEVERVDNLLGKIEELKYFDHDFLDSKKLSNL